MTACIIHVADQCVSIITDTLATVDGAAGARFDYPKCIPIAHQRLAALVQGKQALGASVVRALATFATDFDSGRSLMMNGLKGLAAEPYVDPSERVAWSSEWVINVAGWSRDKRGPAAFRVSNKDKDGFVPWEVVDVPYLSVSPAVGPALAEDLRNDPERNFLAVLTEQSRLKPNAVGGMAVATTIYASHIEQGVLGKIEAAKWRAPMVA